MSSLKMVPVNNRLYVEYHDPAGNGHVRKDILPASGFLQ